MKVFRTFSSEETRKFASQLASDMLRVKKYPPRATVFSLVGDLGSGKTTFVQGFFRGLGIKKRAVSPTFILFRRVALRHAHYANVYHVDAYRIKNPRELDVLGFREILRDPSNIVLIEWADRVRKLLPRRHVRLYFEHKKEHQRVIRCSQ